MPGFDCAYELSVSVVFVCDTRWRGPDSWCCFQLCFNTMSKCDSVKIQIEELILKLDYVTEEEADGLTRKLHDTLRKGIQKWVCQVRFLIVFFALGNLFKNPSKNLYLETLVDSYLQTLSRRMFRLLVEVPSPFDEVNLISWLNVNSNSSFHSIYSTF